MPIFLSVLFLSLKGKMRSIKIEKLKLPCKYVQMSNIIFLKFLYRTKTIVDILKMSLFFKIWQNDFLWNEFFLLSRFFVLIQTERFQNIYRLKRNRFHFRPKIETHGKNHMVNRIKVRQSIVFVRLFMIRTCFYIFGVEIMDKIKKQLPNIGLVSYYFNL